MAAAVDPWGRSQRRLPPLMRHHAHALWAVEVRLGHHRRGLAGHLQSTWAHEL